MPLQLTTVLGCSPVVGCSTGGIMASTFSTASAARLPHHSLTVAFEKLLSDLAASSASDPHSLTRLPMLWPDKYGCFFCPHEDKDERRWQVRLQLLTDIGKCPTLKHVEMGPLYEIGVERAEEVEALLGGLVASNAVLEELRVSKGLVSEVSCRGTLGSLLRNTRTLKVLILSDADLDAAGLGHLVQALLANSNRVALRHLDLEGNKVGDAEGAAHVAALLQDNALPGLSHLDIVEIGLDVEGAHLIARALATNSTLEELRLGGGDQNDAVALVLQLGLGEVAVDSAHSSSNRSIKTVAIWNGDHSCLDAIMAAMRTNSVLEKLRLRGLVLLDSDQHASSIKAWFENSKSAMRFLDLSHVKASKTVKLAIFTALRSNRTLVHLCMDGWTDLDDELFGCLMYTLQINTTLRNIDMSATSWRRQGKAAFVRQVLQRNLDFVDCSMASLFLCEPLTAPLAADT